MRLAKELRRGLGSCAVLVGLSCGGIVGVCQESAADRAYEFPVKPGSEAWARLSVIERRQASDVPESVAKGLSTAGLVKTVLAYPLRVELLLLNSNPGQALRTLTARFGGLRELLSRPDAGRALLAAYTKLSRASSTSLRGQDVLDHTLITVMLAEDSVIDTLSMAERQELGTTALRMLALQRQAIGPCASEGYSVRILAKLVLSKGVSVQVNGRAVGREDLGGASADDILRPDVDFVPGRPVLDKLVALGRGA